MNRIALEILVVVFALLRNTHLQADDWPQFLGPDRNGISTEKDLLETWPEGNLRPLWKVSLGEGMSGISVAGNRMCTMYQDEKNQFVVCLDTETGEKKWETPIAPRYENSMGHGPRATPTIQGSRVFAYSGEGILACLDLDTGKAIWSKKLHTGSAPESRAKPAEYGMSSSPLVVDQQVIVHCNPGGKGNSLRSFSVADGKPGWSALKIHPGYSSPVLLDNGSQKQVLLFGGTALAAVQLNGKSTWTIPFETEYNCNTANPVVADGKLLISAGENHGTILLDVDAEKAPREVWKSFGRDSVLRSEWQTPVLHKGHLYGIDNVGSAGPISNLVCVELATGKQKWIKKRFGKSNLILADGKLFLSTMKGDLVVVTASPDGYEEIGRQKLIGQTRQAPALSNGRIFLRDNAEVICVNVKKQSRP